MSTSPSFHDLVRRARAGEEEAAAELVRRYEPAIRRFVRMRLTDPRLGRVLDSMDICQSVLGNFFVRIAAGQFELDSPEQMLKLLATMARNKLIDHGRKLQAVRRGQGASPVGHPEVLAALADPQASPSRILSGRELLAKVRESLTAEERHLADQRALGREWAEIAKDLNAGPDALRMKLTRALNRVAAQLGLEEVS